MIAEVMAIGDELTSGQRLDTNSQWLSHQLGEIGIRTMFHTTVGDDLEANVRALREAASRVDVLITTGGLGPTADDLTRQALAAAFGLELELDAASLAHIEHMFQSRGRRMPERNRVQAMFPGGSRVIANPHGTAPGIDLTTPRGNNETRVFALPGVPAEMREMWHETVRPALASKSLAVSGVVRHFRLKCFGVGESDLEARLPDLIRRGREPSVGITASEATITLRVTAAGATEAACRSLMAPTIDTIRDCLGDLIFGEEDDELQHAVCRLLRERGQSLATCEWGSGGTVAHWLRDVPDGESVLAGGVVVRDAASASQLLGVDARLEVREHVRELAVAVRRQLGADYGLAVGAFPDLAADLEAKVYLGLATPQEAVVAGRRFAGHPRILKARAAKQALDLIRLHLLKSA